MSSKQHEAMIKRYTRDIESLDRQILSKEKEARRYKDTLHKLEKKIEELNQQKIKKVDAKKAEEEKLSQALKRESS
ncbi:hypothetical protein [Pseudodesulfovibrio sp.]|uniref:hypothetical protein n=1 Tax=unclassified Pseudodesulfovibrio TaxID=2661612 RepID=UPI003B00B676